MAITDITIILIATQDANIHKYKISQFDVEKSRVKLNNHDDWFEYDLMISTISPEHLLKCFGELRWMGRDFLKIVLPVKELFQKIFIFNITQIKNHLLE